MRTSLFSWVVLAGCSDQGFHATTEVDDAAPHVDVFPTELDFGVRRTDQLHRQSFTVRNKGNADLRVEGIDLLDARFDLLTGGDPAAIAPGSSLTVEVGYQPWPGEVAAGVIVVRSDDAREPEVPVYLTGEAAVADLYIDPPEVDFGTIGLACEASVPLRLLNQGDDPLVVSEVVQRGPGYAALLPELPLTLEPGAWVDGELLFTPELEAAVDGLLSVTSNDPAGVESATQRGVGTPIPTRSEEFLVPGDPPIDILFAIDQSGSMADDADALAANFAVFITMIAEVTSNWTVAVVTSDSGCFSTWVDARTPDYETAFAEAVEVHTGIGYWEPPGEGDLTERLLTITKTALVDEYKGCNDGFVREGVTTHVVAVSDEPEQSADSPAELVAEMQSTTPNLMISAVAGDVPFGCATADPGEGYDEAVSLTGGIFLSICEGWGSHVEQLAQATLEEAYHFALSGTPLPESIVVEVDGIEVETGWGYDETTNEVVMAAPLPLFGEVLVTYSEAIDCPA